jgi:hypothetical protein
MASNSSLESWDDSLVRFGMMNEWNVQRNVQNIITLRKEDDDCDVKVKIGKCKPYLLTPFSTYFSTATVTRINYHFSDIYFAIPRTWCGICCFIVHTTCTWCQWVTKRTNRIEPLLQQQKN